MAAISSILQQQELCEYLAYTTYVATGAVLVTAATCYLMYDSHKMTKILVAAYKNLLKEGESRIIFEKHSTYTILDLDNSSCLASNVPVLEKSLSFFETGMMSLARAMKHCFMALLSLCSFKKDTISHYSTRVSIDLKGFGIGLIGTFSPSKGKELSSDLFKKIKCA